MCTNQPGCAILGRRRIDTDNFMPWKCTARTVSYDKTKTIGMFLNDVSPDASCSVLESFGLSGGGSEDGWQLTVVPCQPSLRCGYI